MPTRATVVSSAIGSMLWDAKLCFSPPLSMRYLPNPRCGTQCQLERQLPLSRTNDVVCRIAARYQGASN